MLIRLLTFAVSLLAAVGVFAQPDAAVPDAAGPDASSTDRPAAQATDRPAEPAGERKVLILVGLPGDEAHATLFQQTVRAWQTWLTEQLGCNPENILLLSGRDPSPEPNRSPATQEAIQQHVEQWKKGLQPGDSLWVFLLGHANDFENRAYFHLPGPDLDDRRLGAIFADVSCREQVFWLTHACSGMFLKALSKPGRVVITATTPEAEINETEFPQALAAVITRDPHTLDTDQDQRISLREVFDATVREVDMIFQSDMRTPTEHALLDDNGDGQGTESSDLAKPIEPEENDPPDGATEPTIQPVAGPSRDGLFAAEIFLPWKFAPPTDAEQDDQNRDKDAKADGENSVTVDRGEDGTTGPPPSNSNETE